MKNCILFIIDSLNYKHLKESPIELMPFLKKLENKGISCEHMYSQAPYTEAAVMDIYCGQNVLDHGGYMYRFKDTPLTIFETLKSSGYSTYYNSYQPQCHPSSVRRGVDYLFYNVGYDQGALWSYRLSHFSGLYKEGKLTDSDYRTLQELFDDNLSEWLRFVEDILAKRDCTKMIIDNAPNYDAKGIKKALLKEFEKYKQNPKEYINSVLEQGQNHPLIKLPSFNQNLKIKDRSFMDICAREMTPLFKRIKRMDLQLNVKNAAGKIMKNPFGKLGQFIMHPNKSSGKDLAKSLFLTGNYLVDLDLYDRIKSNYDSFKNAPSARTHIDYYMDWAKKQKPNQPHFACIHIDDVHNPEVFFTYDSQDIDLLRKEKKMAEEILDQIPSNYYGSLTHDLSLRYIDSVVEYLFDCLKSNNMLEDTYVAICADHGFSFSGNPIRDSFVVNLFLENYNIPFVIYGSDLQHQRIKKLCTSKDIPSTLCDVLTGNVPSEFTGHSIIRDHEYPYLQIEYCGGGCPDLARRELKMAAFDSEYFVGTLATITDSLDGNVTEIYDLTKDPMQYHNLVNKKYDSQKVDALLNSIKSRRNQIRNWMQKNK